MLQLLQAKRCRTCECHAADAQKKTDCEAVQFLATQPVWRSSRCKIAVLPESQGNMLKYNPLSLQA